MNKKIVAFFVAFLSFATLWVVRVSAFQSTSTDFKVCGNTGYVAGNSTSGDFGLVSYGNTDAMQVSTSGDFTVSPGIEAIFGCATSTAVQSISLVINPSTISLPNLVPGTPVTATTTVTVTASGATNGYFLQIYRNSATSTLASSSILFPDATPWSLSGTTCAVGQGNATATLGQNFSFRVASSGTSGTYCPLWWGASDASGTAAYAGVPTAGTTIINSTNTNSENGSTTVAIVYRANASATTTIAAYTGQVTITAIANP